MKKGQVLVIMLVLVGFVMVIMSTALVLSLAGSTATTGTSDAVAAQYGAEAGLENGLMRLLRNPAFTTESFQVGRASVTVQVTGSGPYIVQAVANAGLAKRTVSAQAQFANGIMSVTNWKDIY